MSKVDPDRYERLGPAKALRQMTKAVDGLVQMDSRDVFANQVMVNIGNAINNRREAGVWTHPTAKDARVKDEVNGLIIAALNGNDHLFNTKDFRSQLLGFTVGAIQVEQVVLDEFLAGAVPGN